MPPTPSSLDGRHIVITGGTGALGSAVAGMLIDRGGVCHVTCLDTSELKRFELASHPLVKIHTGIDLTDEDRVGEVFDAATGAAKAGAAAGLWASIHLAGGFAMGAIEQTRKADFLAQFNTNTLTCFLCCREAVRAMKAAGAGGRIVNVAARPALFPELGGGMVAYTAAKAAVAAITQALAAEVAAHGILVNAVVPSIMDTPANRKSMPNANHDAWPKTQEVAATIVFLASPENRVTRAALVPVYGRS